MKIDNEFTVGVPIERAWEVLTDLEGIAPCLPGAQLTGVDGDVYRGRVKVKVGPVISQYAGTAQFVERDDAAYHGVIRAKGKDSRGAGNASALIDAQLRAEGASTVVTVSTDLNITGKIAQFGSGMIKEVSAKLLGQFVRNLEGELLTPAPADPAPDPATAEPSTGSGAATTTEPAPAAEFATAGGTEPSDSADRAADQDAAAERPAADRPAAAEREPDAAPSSPGANGAAPAAGTSAPSTDGSTPAGRGPATTTSSTTTSSTTASSTTASSPTASSTTATPGSGTPTTGTPTTARSAGAGVAAPRREAEPLDLMSLAGSSVYKRLIPPVVVLVIIVAVVVYLVAR